MLLEEQGESLYHLGNANLKNLFKWLDFPQTPVVAPSFHRTVSSIPYLLPYQRFTLVTSYLDRHAVSDSNETLR